MRLFGGSYTKMITQDFGGHGEGLYSLNFDSENGTIKIIDTCFIENPSYVTITNNILYTFNEVSLGEAPYLYAFRINEDGTFGLINKVAINGSYPCHITHSPEYDLIFVSCYGSGNVLLYSLNPDGSVGHELQKIQHHGKSKNPSRQDAPHVHYVGVDGTSGDVFVADLGIDKILMYAPQKASTLPLANKGCIQIPEGSGPRHFVWLADNRFLMVLTELTAEVFVIDLSSRKIIGTLKLPMDDSGLVPGAAAIKISGDGRFIYISERATNKIFILKFDDSKKVVQLVGEVSARVITPRDFLLDLTGNWLIVAGQDSNSLSLFKRDIQTGTIEHYKTLGGFKSISCLM